jgi:toxin-antitoxin system PIN domain toxin
MIALDTNVLVYARRSEVSQHAKARQILEHFASGNDLWALAWPCVYEFLRVITHPRVFDPPTNPDAAVKDLLLLFESPSLQLLGEGPAHPVLMRRVLDQSGASGNLVHDAHIAALLIEHGVRELWTADRDFSRFPGLNVRDPFRG